MRENEKKGPRARPPETLKKEKTLGKTKKRRNLTWKKVRLQSGARGPVESNHAEPQTSGDPDN
jgi:hypothetical protein